MHSKDELTERVDGNEKRRRSVKDVAQAYNLLLERDDLHRWLEAEELVMRNSEADFARQAAELGNADAIKEMEEHHAQRVRAELAETESELESSADRLPQERRALRERIETLRANLAGLEVEVR